jgi:hypothetical protein
LNFNLVLRVKLKSGKEYAVDTSGAQCGLYDAIVPWEEYSSDPDMSIVEEERFGATKQRYDQVEVGIGGPQDARPMAAVLNANAFGKALRKTMEVWTKKEKMTIKSLMRLGPAQYEEMAESLLSCINERLGKFAEEGMKSRDLIVKAESKEVMKTETKDGVSTPGVRIDIFTRGDGTQSVTFHDS